MIQYEPYNMCIRHQDVTNGNIGLQLDTKLIRI